MLRATLALCVLTVAALAGRASAQAGCPRVLARFEPPGTNGDVLSLCTYDDGTGPALYLGGRFYAAGTVGAANIARFDGATWSPLGAGLGQGEAFVGDLLVFDLGAGPRLVAGGSFAYYNGTLGHVAAWNGSSWTTLGGFFNSPVRAVAVFDDGAGPKLYAGGQFDFPASRVARFNGTAWEAVGTDAIITWDLAVHDDGTGPALYAAGFQPPGLSGQDTPRVTKWTGSSWAPVGLPFDHYVFGLASHDDGSGSKLYVAIGREGEAMQGVRRWNGAVWESVGTLTGAVRSLTSVDLLDGNGLDLYAAGDPLMGGVARWDGTAWSSVGSGPIDQAFAVAAFDTGSGRQLVAGLSQVSSSSLESFGIARLDGSSWIPIQSGRGIVQRDPSSFGAQVNALAQHDSGSGPEVHVGGNRMSAQPELVDQSLARWTGTEWSPVSPNHTLATETILSIESFDLGAGRELFVGTEDSGVWRWNGAGWSLVPSGPTPFTAVNDFLVFDLGSGPRLAVAGRTPRADGFEHAVVQVWDGVTWTQIGADMGGWGAYALCQFDDGTGPQLYCAGRFGSMNGVPNTVAIARWNGTTWSSVGGGVRGSNAWREIYALAEHDDGSGPALYVGGSFSMIGGAPIADFARWTAAGWSAVGGSGLGGDGTGGLHPYIRTLAVHDDGTGPRLWAGGWFHAIAGVPARQIARWDGAAWSAYGSGADEAVAAMASFDEGTGHPRTLWVTGRFSSIDGRASPRVARIGCAPDTAFPFCFGDAAHGPSPCPCGNAGATGHGCASAASPAGAVLSATGSIAPTGPGGADTVVLQVSGLPAATTALFLQGSTGMPPVPFGDGLRCVGGTQIRLGTKIASAGSADYPGTGDPPLSVRGMTPYGSALTRFYQVWYHTPVPLCTSATFNMSNALTITW